MTDGFTAWKLMQDRMLAVQQAQIEAATKVMGMGADFAGAADAARKVADANMRAWETWMGLWGRRG